MGYQHENKAGVWQSLRKFRQAKKVTQEDFGVVSSRTYVSSLEQAYSNFEKIEDLAKVLKVHPLSLLFHQYAGAIKRNALRADPGRS